MDLSIIIVNWNTRDITLQCLESIYSNQPELDYEVIVIDNDSSDDSVEKIKEVYPQVDLIESDRNGGFAWANNVGMEKAKGDYFLLLNSDTIVLGDVLEKTLEFMKSKPEAGVVGCRVLNNDETMQPTCFMYPSALNMLISAFYLNKLFKRNRFFGRELMTWWDRTDERVVQAVTGCFMLVSKQHVDEIGMMDDSFFMYAEETDWCYRFDRAGYKNYFTPAGRIIHLGGASTARVKPKMILQLRSGILQFIKKQRSFIHYAAACLLTSFWFLIRLPYWFISYLMNMKNIEKKMLVKTYLTGFAKALGGYRALRRSS